MKVIVIGAHRTGTSKLCLHLSAVHGVYIPIWPNVGAEILNSTSIDDQLANIKTFNESTDCLVKIMPHHWLQDFDDLPIEWDRVDLIATVHRASVVDTYISWAIALMTRQFFGTPNSKITCPFSLDKAYLDSRFIETWYNERIKPINDFVAKVKNVVNAPIMHYSYEDICKLTKPVPLEPTGLLYERDCSDYMVIKDKFMSLGII